MSEHTMREEIEQANICLGSKLLAHETLLEACQVAEIALLDAVHALNDEGIAAPVSLGLAGDKLRRAIKKAKGETP